MTTTKEKIREKLKEQGTTTAAISKVQTPLKMDVQRRCRKCGKMFRAYLAGKRICKKCAKKDTGVA